MEIIEAGQIVEALNGIRVAIYSFSLTFAIGVLAMIFTRKP